MFFLIQTATSDISSGDIRYGESTAQHQHDLLIAGHGDYKEYPAVGVGTVRFLHDNLPEDYLREVSKAFQGDSMTVERISYDERYEYSNGGLLWRQKRLRHRKTRRFTIWR